MSAQKIKKGDRVVILSGRDKGKHGEVTRSMPKDGKVLVSGASRGAEKVSLFASLLGHAATRQVAVRLDPMAAYFQGPNRITATIHEFLEPGRYVLFCNLPGHYEAGQRAKLVVR